MNGGNDLNGKLLAMGILALLMIASFPASGAAAPIKEPVYMLTGCTAPNTGEFTVTCTVGDVVGKVVLGNLRTDRSTGETTFPVTYSVNNLVAGNYYNVVLIPAAPHWCGNLDLSGSSDKDISHRRPRADSIN